MVLVKILGCLLASILASLCDVHAATQCNGDDFHCYSSAAFQVCVDNGTVEETPAAYACPTGTSCHLTCDLPCADPTSPCAKAPPPPPGKQVCNTGGFYCATSTEFQQCLGTATTPQPDLYSCPPNTVCDMNCEYECRSPGVTCSPPVPPPTTTPCNQAGFHAVKGDNRKYVLCTEFPTFPVSFKGQEYSCPGGGYFVSGKCTMNEPFVCKENGKTANPKSCSSYYFCSFIDEATGWATSQYNCPSSSLYNPTTKRCDSAYVCPPIATTRVLSRTLAVQFACSAQGRFPDMESSVHYYLCVVQEGGSYVHRRYRCPGSSAFDPNASRCSTDV